MNVEQHIQRNGLTAPRVTPADVMNTIVGETYTVMPNGRTTVCQLTLRNGYTVEGMSACVSLENFNEEVGNRIARENAIEEIWPLLGYELSTRVAGQMEKLARTCHEVNRAYCESMGDTSQLPWEQAPEWQRVSARMGVDLHLMGNFGPEASHVSWMNQKLADGWKYGPVKDANKKEHPCMVAFADLPREQQAKDFIFRAIVHALRDNTVQHHPV